MAQDLAKLKRTIQGVIKADRDTQKVLAAAEGAIESADTDFGKLIAAVKGKKKDVAELD